jgi:undecaprenyl-diphosphatase
MDFEIKIIEFLQSGRNLFFDSAFKVLTVMGSLLAVFVTCVLLLWKKRNVLFWYLASYGVSALVVWVLKSRIARVRPYNASSLIVAIGGTSTDFSFPSGHSACATAIAIFVGYCLFTYYKKTYQRVGIVALCTLFVALVGLSRMYLGMHYLTDVLAGVAISAIFCTIGIVLMRLYEKQKKVKNETKNDSSGA